MVSTDIKYYLSGTAVTGDTSLGGSTQPCNNLAPTTLNNLFHYVSPETAAGTDNPNLQTIYRAIDVKNTHVSQTLYGAVIYIDTATPSSATAISIALETSATLQSITNEYTAPSGTSPLVLSSWYSESTASTKATGLSLGDMATGAIKRIWLKRVVTPTAGMSSSDAGQITVTGGVSA